MDTTNYLILGYGVIFGVLLMHLASVYMRDRNARKELKMFEELQKPSGRKRLAKKKKPKAPKSASLIP